MGMWVIMDSMKTTIEIADDLLLKAKQLAREQNTTLRSLTEELLGSAQISGPRIHDAKIASICLQSGVRELWTADRDFSRFPALKTRNPLIT